MNLVLDESVSGRFSIDVRAVPLDEFFAIVLRTNGLAARRVGTSLLIAKEDQLRSRVDATQAATFRLNNATAKDVATILEKVLGSQGGGGGGAQGGGVRITVDDRTNSILVVGTGEDLARIRNTIRAVDVPAPQVMIEVQLVEIGVNHLRQLEGQLGFGGSKFGFANNVTSVQSTANGQPAAGLPASGGGTSVTFSSMGNVTANLQAR
jgi:type IV pilus assembly protein PilQ